MEQILKSKISVPEWNLKEIDTDLYRKLEKSILKNGQVKNLVVRSTGEGNYELIDGKIVFQILQKLDVDFVWCYVYKSLSPLEAILIYLQLDFYFDKDFINLSQYIEELSKEKSLIDISRMTDYSVKEISDLIKLTEFDFDKYKPEKNTTQDNLF